jgi:metal-sulfur cluster biosynthetic enzyme
VLAEAVEAFYAARPFHARRRHGNLRELSDILHFHPPLRPAWRRACGIDLMDARRCRALSLRRPGKPARVDRRCLASASSIPRWRCRSSIAGLVCAVTVTPERLHALLTMTSPACPVADLIVDDAAAELDRLAPAGMAVDVELAWVPAWTADRMSARAEGRSWAGETAARSVMRNPPPDGALVGACFVRPFVAAVLAPLMAASPAAWFARARHAAWCRQLARARRSPSMRLLMTCAFMGTVIALERAVAVKHPLAFLGPLASAPPASATLTGAGVLAAWLVVAASLAFVVVTPSSSSTSSAQRTRR